MIYVKASAGLIWVKKISIYFSCLFREKKSIKFWFHLNRRFCSSTNCFLDNKSCCLTTRWYYVDLEWFLKLQMVKQYDLRDILCIEKKLSKCKEKYFLLINRFKNFLLNIKSSICLSLPTRREFTNTSSTVLRLYNFVCEMTSGRCRKTSKLFYMICVEF